MIEDILPAAVACAFAHGDDPAARPLPEEAARLGRAAEARVREFATARGCARRALRALGLPAGPIPRGPEREPLWPPGVVGSITHCRGYRAAAVARGAEVASVGIDAEPHDGLPADVRGHVLGDGERAWLAQAPAGVHWDRLLFSAKESIYKAWFPLTGRWLGFGDVAMSLDPAGRRFHARFLVAPPVVAGRELAGLDGRFLVRDGLVLTAVVLFR